MRIIFRNGTIVEAEQNGNCFITGIKPAFPVPLGTVRIEGDESYRIEHARLVECASVDGRYWFTFIEIPADEDMIAATKIESGKYFNIGDNLYKATTTIPARDGIIPGTNCQQFDLAEALNALNI